MEQGSNEGTSTTQNPSMTVEIKIKTLDSQDYTCHVDQNISIPALKEHVATLTGVPVERQRLICRGKVLKDDHNLSAYNVEDGHVLHLVTREASQSSGAPSGGNSRRTEEPAGGPGDPTSAAPRNRPGQVSHSVVLGTFSIPDHGEGGIPDVGRIISTVLSSLGVANLGQPNAGANAGAVAGMVLPGAQPSFTNAQEVVASVETPPNEAAVGPSESGVAQGTGSIGAAANTSRPAVDTVHPLGQQFRFMQPQVIPDPFATMSQYGNRIPDALATMSQYLNRLEQVFGTPGPVSLSAGNQTFFGAAEAAARTFPTPANLGSIIRRTMGLLSGHAGAELLRLASQLENEPNLAELTARGEVQSSAMREGVLLQHFGALLLELGRTTLTLRMGASPAESFVNSGPAVFISQAGPNPMMVQPLPFQPGVGLNPLSGLTHQILGAAGTGSPEMPRNINIHIHTNDAGMVPGLPSQPQVPLQVPLPVQGGLIVPAQVSRMGPFTGPGDGRMSAPSGAAPPERAPLPNSSSGLTEQPGVRVVPMRTVVAAVPSALHGRPPPDNAGASLGLFYPLLARFQQLNAQQANGAAQGVPAGSPVAQGGAATTDQSANPAAPTVRAQVQIQAWVPQLPDGQGGMRPLTNEEALHAPSSLPTQGAALMNSQQQRPLENSSEGRSQEQVPQPTSEQRSPADAVTGSGGQQSGLHDDTTANSSHQEKATNTADEVAKSNTGQGESQARSVSNGENVSDAERSSGSRPSTVSNIPVGLGLRGLQPLPPRAFRRSSRPQGGQEPSINLTQQRDDLGRPNDTQGSPAGAIRLEGVPSSGAQIPAGFSQLLNAVVNQGQPARGGSSPDLGNMIPQLIGHLGGENSFPTSAAPNDAVQGLGLPGGALGNMLGQVMQSPFMRNMVQQMVEQVGDEPQGIQDAIVGMGSEGGLNFSGILQQMMPIVSQALGRVSTTSLDQPLGSSVSLLGTGNRAQENGVARADFAPSQMRTFDQGEMLQSRDAPPNRVEEEATADRSAETEVNPGCAPVAKRQKINLEKAFEKVEQGSAPSDIVRVMAESAVASMALNDTPGRVDSQLAEHLLQDDLLVNEYVALLLRDLGGYLSADSTS